MKGRAKVVRNKEAYRARAKNQKIVDKRRGAFIKQKTNNEEREM